MRRRAVATSVLIFSLSVVSTTFVLLALTSKRWAVQRYYPEPTGAAALGADWVKPICFANKSPFYRCGLPVINDTAKPWTCTVQNCQFYAPYGRNQTSCRLGVETNGSDALSDITAGEQECQQVHYTGNIQIASSVFIVLGLILLLPLTLGNFLLALGAGRGREEPPRPAEVEEASSTAPVAKTSNTHTTSNGASHKHPFSKKLSPYTPYVVLTTLFCLYAGAVLQILAQFFGVLGLTITATPAPTTAVQYNQGELGATPWIIDKALSTYATVAWTSALATAGLIGFVYRTPRFEKFV